MLAAPLQFIVAMIAYAINRRMARQLDYLQEEVRVLKEGRHADGLPRVAERVFDDDLVLLLAEHEADARLVPIAPELGIRGGQVEVHLAGVLRLELAGVELDNDEAAEPQVEEEEVDVEVLASDLEVHLAAHEREADAELEEEVAHVLEQAALEVPLLRVGAQREEVEDVRVLQGLLREVGVGRRERALEVRERLACALVQASLNLGEQHVA